MRLTVEERVFILESYLHVKSMSYIHCRQSFFKKIWKARASKKMNITGAKHFYEPPWLQEDKLKEDIVRNLVQKLPPYCIIASLEVHKSNELSRTYSHFPSSIYRKQNDPQLIRYAEIHAVDATYFVRI